MSDPRTGPISAARLNDTRKALAAIIGYAETILAHLDDIHVLAYDQPATGEPGHTPNRSDKDLSNVGDHRAKQVLDHLASRKGDGRHPGIYALENDLGWWKSAALALFAGTGADTSLRGTLLGETDPDTGHIRPGSEKAEFNRAVAAKKRRAERGEYTPSPGEPQPKWGGGR